MIRWEVITINNYGFQTPSYVADYMVSLIDKEPKLVLEPSIGEGNLVKALWNKFPNTKVIAYDIEDCPIKDDRLTFIKQDFLQAEINFRPDLILSNPPFTPMTLSYEFFEKCHYIQSRGIYILPYLFLINSTSRPKKYSSELDVRNIINLPRNVFKNSRIQSCILDIYEGTTTNTKYIWYEEKVNKGSDK